MGGKRSKSKARTAAQNSGEGMMAANMAELVGRYGTEEACELHMLSLRWPGGFECPKCGCRSYARVSGRREFCCASCRWQFIRDERHRDRPHEAAARQVVPGRVHGVPRPGGLLRAGRGARAVFDSLSFAGLSAGVFRV